MGQPQVLEGTWEEIKLHEAALKGHFVRVIIEPENGLPPAPIAGTPLGAKLAEIRAEIVVSGEPLLDWQGVAQEVSARRGGHDTDVY